MITLFLADFNTLMREGLRLLLEQQADFKVIGEAAGGPEALRWLARLCPDIAIVDMALPELNGIETTRHIQEMCPTTRVIILSSQPTPERVALALQAGVGGFLLKSSSGRELIEAVRTVWAGEIYLCEDIADRVIENYQDPKKAASDTILLARLSSREREILQLVVEGKTSTEIGRLLSLSPGTVDVYRSRLMRKLGTRNLPSLVKFAMRLGLIPLE